jgi:uncharacterized protein YcaQ
MAKVHRLSRQDARRVAVRAQLLDRERPADLVGKLDARADRKAGLFVVSAVHQDVPFTPDMAAGIDQEIAELAAWLGLERRRAG